MYTNKTKNKLLATMTIMLLFASMVLAVVPLANAVVEDPVVLSATTGNVGDVITVSGVTDDKGSNIGIYWDAIDAAKLMATTVAHAGTGAFSVDVTIPAAVAGEHWILAVDGVSLTGAPGGSSSSRSAQFDVESQIILSPPSGIIGDPVTVTGTGFAASSRITLMFEQAPAPSGTYSTLVTTPGTVTTNTVGSFTANFNVPTRPDNIYDVMAEDAASNVADAPFKVGPTITLNPKVGPSGTVVTITGRGFTAGAIIKDFFISGGGFTDEIMPKVNANLDVLVQNDAAKTFSVQVIVPSLNTPAPSSFPTGMTISVTEYGTDGVATGKDASADFSLTGVTGINADKVIGKTGDVVTVTGANFTHLSGTTFNLRLIHPASGVVVHDFGAGSLSSTGSFSTPVTVSVGIPFGVYILNAVDTYGLNANMTFGIANPAIDAPLEAVSGQLITITGTGFGVFDSSAALFNPPYTVPIAANITIDGLRVATNVPATALAAGIDVVVPTVASTGAKEILINSTLPGLSATKSLNVKETTAVTVTPSTTIRGATVDIKGVNFGRTGTFGNTITVTIVISNTTNANIATLYADTDSTGAFATTWTIPGDATFGKYTVKATDNSVSCQNYATNTVNKLSATTDFNVAALAVGVATGKLTYYQGDTVSFSINSTAIQSGKILVWDTNGYQRATITILDDGSLWTANSVTGLLNYLGVASGDSGASLSIQFKLAADAINNTWTWKATFNDPDTITITGKFDVLYAAGGGVGPQGPAGPQGEPGPKGDTGATGSSGSGSGSGSTGAKGDTGATGAKGDKGDTGSVGPKGDTGPSGDAGSSTWSSTALILAIVALVIGAVAAFLAITLRRNIAK